MAEIRELENMVLSFVVRELQAVLRVDHRNTCGRKKDLRTRVLELLHLKSVQHKICDIYQLKYIQNEQLAQTDQNMHTRSYSTRQICRQILLQYAVSSGKELPPAHQVSLPIPRTNPVHQTTGYTSVTPQQTTSAVYSSYLYPPKVLPPPLQIQPRRQSSVHLDVRLKKLPFYDLLAELLKPSSLMPQKTTIIQENTFMFHLTPQQLTDTARLWDCQIQMRFCLQETSCEQEDCFPSRVAVRVNGKPCPLPHSISIHPGIERKMLSRPVQIDALVTLSPTIANHIQVIWSADHGKRYAVAVYLVRKLSSAKLLSRLKSRGVRHLDYTRGLIKEKLNEDVDSEIATTSLRVSLACPLGKTRMVTPCRASTCSHLQCFDALIFLQMNEKMPTWNCPVCNKPALYDTLVIDSYFQEVLNSKKLLPDENTIQLFQDGSWESLDLKKQKDKDTTESKMVTDSQNCNIDMDTTVDLDESNPTSSKEKKRADVIDLISDKDDDDEHSTPTQSTKKLACGISSPKKSQTSSISSTSYSPEFIIIGLD